MRVTTALTYPATATPRAQRGERRDAGGTPSRGSGEGEHLNPPNRRMNTACASAV